ncbi:copper chaperone PCu(A)C [Cellulomonas sp. Y8]|uniref:copper chaperone PCu(A)C n=1 Tax=Cellulomonas sp. Y8 TaxID=2591145 RepID=UPI003D704C18
MHARTSLPGLAIASVLVLAGCGSSDQADGTVTSPSRTAAETVVVTDPWVKAADGDMSAAFGQIENTGEEAVTIVSVAAPVSTALELHETVENETGEMEMREKDGGFTIPAGGVLGLEPGANHIMMLDLSLPVVAGDEVTFTLTFSDDSTLDFTAPAKDYAGANENYAGDDEMDMGAS